METKKNIPSVYPDPMRGAEQSYSNQNPYSLQTGLNIRDYFASKAMQGIISSPNYGIFDVTNDVHIPTIEQCYKIADAMLKVREETES